MVKKLVLHEREHGECTRNDSDRPRGRSDALKLVPAMVREASRNKPERQQLEHNYEPGSRLEAESYSVVVDFIPFLVFLLSLARFHER